MNEPENSDGDITKAVAIKGAKPASAEATPKIVAKGSGDLAEQILDIAFAQGVKVRQDKDLTELLDAFDVESPIPLEALHAVSLILERVYAENQRMAGHDSEVIDDVDASGNAARPSATLDGRTGKPVPVGDENSPAAPEGSQ